MLYRIQADANRNGMIRPRAIEIYDAPLTMDPVTDVETRGPPVLVDLPNAARQRIADAINAELEGATRAAERLAAARAARQAAAAAAAAAAAK